MDEELVERIEQDPEVRKRVVAARELDELKNSGAWLYLQKRFQKYPERAMQSIARRMLRGEYPSIEEVSFAHGYAVAINDLLTYPDQVDADLERAAETAYRRVKDGEQTAEGAEAPYE